ncbi:MAG: YitT family protein [Clostridia bacterium]|nr:YitT family protein [Clostridia bacterium]
MKKEKKVFNAVIYWVVLNLGTLLLAAGVYFFKSPNSFATGGVSGISIILAKFLPLTQSHLVLIINAILLVVGFIILGKGCTFKTLYCSLVYSLENMAFEYFFPLDSTIVGGQTLFSQLTAQPLLSLVYAILLTGVGSAIIFNCGASSGGTDIIALILKKFSKINVGMALLLTDTVIAASTFFIFGIEAGLYSILGLFAKAFLIDGVIENIVKSKYITIITAKPDEIGNYIINVIERGYTSYDATGGYSHQGKKILITVCKRSEALKLKIKVKQLDPESFVIITDANEILGKGFRGTV